jgi:alpha-beta hydrolase superfamily lysophospholipase
MRQVPEAARPILAGLLAAHAGRLMDGLVNVAAAHRPVIEWGMQQAMHVFGCPTPHEAWHAARAFRTDDVSGRVTQDVLLLAGAEDHYVPLEQLWTQARHLTHARSVTARVFTRAELGQAHCQVGNVPLAVEVMCRWIEETTRSTASP